MYCFNLSLTCVQDQQETIETHLWFQEHLRFALPRRAKSKLLRNYTLKKYPQQEFAPRVSSNADLLYYWSLCCQKCQFWDSLRFRNSPPQSIPRPRWFTLAQVRQHLPSPQSLPCYCLTAATTWSPVVSFWPILSPSRIDHKTSFDTQKAWTDEKFFLF